MSQRGKQSAQLKRDRTYFKPVPLTFNYASLQDARAAKQIADRNEKADAHKQALLRMSQEDEMQLAYVARQTKSKHSPEFWDIVRKILDTDPTVSLESAKRMASY